MGRILAAFDSRTGRAAILAAIAAAAALIAVRFHRDGHMLGDDFALYLRQAQSIFEGNPDQVVADNRFLVRNSPDGISPIAYPWGWPLVLSPFVQWWGLDFAKLKLVEVALLVTALVLLHGVVRRRTNRWVAAAIVLVIATSPVYLGHTDQLLSEYPHFVATLVVIWWIDRLQRNAADPWGPWITARTSDLVVVGLLATLAFNMRRESLALFAVIGAAQAVELVGRYRHRRSGQALELGDVRRLAIPHAVFAGGIVGFQLLLPSMLVPDNGGGFGYIPDRIGDSFAVFTQHLGLYTGGLSDITESGVGWIGVIVVAAALMGGAIACWRQPRLNVPLLVLMVTTMATVGTHFRLVDRYYLQLTPWVLFFAAYALCSLGGALARLGHRWDPRGWQALFAAPIVVAVLVVLAAAAWSGDGGGEELTEGYETPWAAVVVVACAVVALAVAAVAVHLARMRRETEDTADERAAKERGGIRHVATVVAVLPLLALSLWHLTDVPHRIDSAEAFSEDTTDVPRCSRQWLSDAEPPASVFTAIETYTPPDSVVAFYRARLMTLYTDRLTIQPGRLETISRRADYFAMQRDCGYSQPLVTDDEAAEAGMAKIWEDEQWVIWRFPEPDGS